jgi:hypothetical protein
MKEKLQKTALFLFFAFVLVKINFPLSFPLFRLNKLIPTFSTGSFYYFTEEQKSGINYSTVT